MKISEYFTLEEFTRSAVATRRGLHNQPSAIILETLKHTAACMDRLVNLFGQPLSVSSAYRAPAVNKAVGSGGYSQHLIGEAVDFTIKGVNLRAAFDLLRTAGVPYDQLIYEGTWLHISFTKTRSPRRSALVAIFQAGKRPSYHVPNWIPRPYKPPAPVPAPLIAKSVVITAVPDPVEVTEETLPVSVEAIEAPEPIQAPPGARVYQAGRVPALRSPIENLPGSPELFRNAYSLLRQKLKAWLAVTIGFWGTLGGLIKTRQFWFLAVLFLLFCLMVWYIYTTFKRFHRPDRHDPVN